MTHQPGGLVRRGLKVKSAVEWSVVLLAVNDVRIPCGSEPPRRDLRDLIVREGTVANLADRRFPLLP